MDFDAINFRDKGVFVLRIEWSARKDEQRQDGGNETGGAEGRTGKSGAQKSSWSLAAWIYKSRLVGRRCARRFA